MLKFVKDLLEFKASTLVIGTGLSLTEDDDGIPKLEYGGVGSGSAYGIDGFRHPSDVTQNTAKTVAEILERHTDLAWTCPHNTAVTRLVVRLPSTATLTVGTITISVVKGENRVTSTTADATVDTDLEVAIDSTNIADAIADGGVAVEVLSDAFQLDSGFEVLVAYSTTATITGSNLELRASLEVSKVFVNPAIREGLGGSFRCVAGKGQVVSGQQLNILTSTVADPTEIQLFTSFDLSPEGLIEFHSHNSTPDMNDIAHVGTIVSATKFTVPVNVTVSGGTSGELRDVGSTVYSYEKLANAEVAFSIWFKRTGVNSNNTNMIFGARSLRSILLYYDKVTGHITLNHEPTIGGQFGIYTLDMIANGGLNQWIGVGISWDRSDIANLPVIKVIDPEVSVNSFVTVDATEVQAITQDFRTIPSDGWIIGGGNATQGFVGNINNLNVWVEAEGIPTESQMLSALLVNAAGPASPIAHYPLDTDDFQSRLRSDVGPPYNDVRIAGDPGTIYDTIGPPYV